MSQHPDVTTVDRMIKAVLGGDEETLKTVLSDDFQFHYRGRSEAGRLRRPRWVAGGDRGDRQGDEGRH
jgi:hypothetical protein